MPTITRRIRFSNLERTATAEADAVVDTDATFCQIPADMAERLDLVPYGYRRLRMANGQIAEYGIANALVELVDQGETVASAVAIGGPTAAVLLGVDALDAFGLGIDTDGRRLIPKVGDLLLQTGWPTL